MTYSNAVVMVLLAGFEFGEHPRLDWKESSNRLLVQEYEDRGEIDCVLGAQKNVKAEPLKKCMR